MQMKKYLRLVAVFAAVAMTCLAPMTVSAGSWQKGTSKPNSWWYLNDDGSFAKGWQWIDGNQDGIAESYYFDNDGWCLMNTMTPDGYKVNANGAWVQDGNVVTRKVAELQPQAAAQVQSNDSHQQNTANSSSAEQQTYVFNVNSHKFHRPNCPSVKKMKESNKKEFHGTREQAIAEGYEPCKNCNP